MYLSNPKTFRTAKTLNLLIHFVTEFRSNFELATMLFTLIIFLIHQALSTYLTPIQAIFTPLQFAICSQFVLFV